MNDVNIDIMLLCDGDRRAKEEIHSDVELTVGDCLEIISDLRD
ncbi:MULTISPECIES: hypothetical protein [Bacillaceae]|nr:MULTISPECIES: hypothetical protein [Bacillaceae]MDX8360448.1 hypothetical protein [Cytobacillus sp. IB215316]